jgi:nitrous oxide reductase accessory protein NosL
MSFIKLFLLLSLTLNLFGDVNISDAMKQKQIYPMGKKIYTKKCPSLDISSFKTYDDLLDAVEHKGICSKLNKKHSKALSIYLWDKKAAPQKKEYKKITITKDEKCQVCGMYLHYYPSWVAEIDYPKNETYKFDGIKDMMKFYFNNEEGIVNVLVQDYYSLKTLDAHKAYYVIGSDVLGPMGNELIAFSDKKSAKIFFFDHKGKKLLSFDELTAPMVHDLDR